MAVASAIQRFLLIKHKCDKQTLLLGDLCHMLNGTVARCLSEFLELICWWNNSLVNIIHVCTLHVLAYMILSHVLEICICWLEYHWNISYTPQQGHRNAWITALMHQYKCHNAPQQGLWCTLQRSLIHPNKAIKTPESEPWCTNTSDTMHLNKVCVAPFNDLWYTPTRPLKCLNHSINAPIQVSQCISTRSMMHPSKISDTPQQGH
jgi:hypothetical protein